MKDPEKLSLIKDAQPPGANTSETSPESPPGSAPARYSATGSPYTGASGESGYQDYTPTKAPELGLTDLELTRKGSVFDEGITLCWKNVRVKAETDSKNSSCLDCLKGTGAGPSYKHILKSVNGVAKAGSFLVVMGASGSGKTTLLNVLTQRHLSRLQVEAAIFANGRKIGEEINTLSGFIQQDDLFVGTLTVREHLWFNAVLRMGKNIPDDQRRLRIEEVMQEMGLKKCEDTLIGVPGMVKGLSGGEKKRLAFASELLTRPSIMFCDEPTSGLDSFMAQSVIESLKKLTAKGRTVLCTIHQPSSEVFAMFDEILMMAEGRVAFMGPTNEMTDFFADLGYICPRNYNPADFFIMSLAIVPGKEQECRDNVARICDTYDESKYARAIDFQTAEQEQMYNDNFVMEMDSVSKDSSAELSDSDRFNKAVSTKKRYEATWWKQFKMCLWRAVIDVMRNKRVLPARVLQVTVAGIFLGALYWQQDYTMTGVANINGALFMLMIQVSFNVAFTIATAFAKEFPVFLKENQDRQYCVSAYYLGKVLVDLPVIAVAAVMYTTCAYWMIGLYPTATAFFICMAALLLMSEIAVAYGHLCSAIFPNPQLALTLLPFMLGLTLLFSGFLIKQNSIVKIFKPIAWLSSYKYTYEILIVNQWQDVTHIECDFTDKAYQMRSDLNVTTDYASKDHLQSSNWCYPNGLAVIYSYEYQTGQMFFCFTINVVIFFCVEALGYTFLRIRASRKK